MFAETFTKTYFYNKKLIINLIGSNNIMNKCAQNIQYFAYDYGLHAVISENNLYSLSRNIYYNSPNVIINPCGIITCDEIDEVKYKIYISSLNTYSCCNFLVKSNTCDVPDNIKDELMECKNIDEIYDLENNDFYKKKILERYFLHIF